MATWIVDVIGTTAAVLGTICWLPQAIRTIQTKETKSLSLWSNLLLFATVSLWFVYGLAISAWPLVAANTISILLVGLIVIMKLRHG
ncbi:SemiSWEET family sugar transporter [Rhizobium sp. CC-YZS058]|uniref:SemiSWEET family sugar transporter n=1 Tax=Rhizobium sp. CC-YZS058 TaxID=3042153 RepID=UPI002B05A096|nr:SemiSWEET family transporter [Rhizobium sp. CC-YZS058]MEA3534075.1 SemiSWEET family transporter [Rhizobium sp. CC-YZS058]